MRAPREEISVVLNLKKRETVFCLWLAQSKQSKWTSWKDVDLKFIEKDSRCEERFPKTDFSSCSASSVNYRQLNLQLVENWWRRKWCNCRIQLAINLNTKVFILIVSQWRKSNVNGTRQKYHQYVHVADIRALYICHTYFAIVSCTNVLYSREMWLYCEMLFTYTYGNNKRRIFFSSFINQIMKETSLKYLFYWL